MIKKWWAAHDSRSSFRVLHERCYLLCRAYMWATSTASPKSPQKLTSLLPVERILLSTAISCLERIPRPLLQDSTLGFTVAPRYSTASSSVTHPMRLHSHLQLWPLMPHPAPNCQSAISQPLLLLVVSWLSGLPNTLLQRLYGNPFYSSQTLQTTVCNTVMSNATAILYTCQPRNHRAW